MDRKNGQRNGGNEITATLPRSTFAAIEANDRRTIELQIVLDRPIHVARSRVITRSTGSAFRVSRFPENLFVLRIRWTIFEERETRWLASRVGSVTLWPIVFTRR